MSHNINSNIMLPHILPVKGATNFRELGGYPATDGRRVKYGIFYRGGTLFDLKNASDRAVIENLGLKFVLDFRSKGESIEYPDFVPNGASYLRVGAMYYPDGTELDFSPAGMERLERELAAAPMNQSPVDMINELYTQMPFGNPAFQTLFRVLEEGSVPLLFHCASGKDRTGVAAMLILLALGVEPKTAVADYIETNHCRATEIEALKKQYKGLDKENPKLWEEYLIRYGVIPRFANATLDAILKRYGNWETYFNEEFGLTHSRLAALRDAYLN